MTRRGDTDHLVRLIEGYGRVFDDPPAENDKLVVKMRMGALILQAFRDLHDRLQAGAQLPEVWDRVVGYVPRTRTDAGEYWYTYPPGVTGPAPCTTVFRSAGMCDWIDPHAPVTACLRCHTIRHRVR